MTVETLELRQYQHDAAVFLHFKKRAIDGDAPGAGKTATVIAALDAHYPVIVVCPVPVVSHWENEVQRWTGGRALTINATGTAKQRRDARREFFDMAAHGPAVLITNYEAVRRDIDELVMMPGNSLVLDEAHRVKNARSKIFKAVQRLAYGRPVFFAVTGTPILNRPEELWPLLHLIDPQRWSSYWNFVDHYCETEVTTFRGKLDAPTKIVLGMKPGMEAVLRQELHDVMVRRPLEDLLPELPAITVTTHRLDLSPHERKLYDQMEKFYFAQNDDGTQVIAPNDVSKMTRLRQLVADTSLLGLDEGKVSTKLAAAKDFIDDLFPEPVLVFATHKTVVEKIAYMTQGAYIHGDVPQATREGIINAFSTRSIRVLAGTIRAMGEGIDGLQQSARHVIFLDQDWTPARNDQAVARLHRHGQTADAVFVQIISANDTIDEYVTKTLARKESVIDAIVGHDWDQIVRGGER